MNEKTISKYIDVLSEKIGVAAEHIYSTLYKQAIVYGIINLFVGVILLIGLIVSIKLVVNIYTKSKFEEVKGDWSTTFIPLNNYAKFREIDFVDDGYIWWVCGIGWIILLVIIFVSIPEGILHVFNPGYYAIKDILEALKG